MNERHGPLAALYAEVYARPEDDELRSVLADALMAVGDPHGEFIVAQLDPSRDHERRAMRLRQQHGLTWLGPLRGSVIPLGYARGFLTSCQTLDVAPALRDCGEWATIEHVELTTARADFLQWPGFRSLRSIANVRRNQLGVACAIDRVREIVTSDRKIIRRDADGRWVFPTELADDDDDDDD